MRSFLQFNTIIFFIVKLTRCIISKYDPVEQSLSTPHSPLASPLVAEGEVEEGVGYLGATHAAKYVHPVASHGHREVAAGGRALPVLRDFFPKVGLTLVSRRNEILEGENSYPNPTVQTCTLIAKEQVVPLLKILVD